MAKRGFSGLFVHNNRTVWCSSIKLTSIFELVMVVVSPVRCTPKSAGNQ